MDQLIEIFTEIYLLRNQSQNRNGHQVKTIWGYQRESEAINQRWTHNTMAYSRFSWVPVYVVLCIALLVRLTFCCWQLYCLSYFEIRLLIISLVSSNFSHLRDILKKKITKPLVNPMISVWWGEYNHPSCDEWENKAEHVFHSRRVQNS
jgi:hypothetical protein